MAKYSFNSNQGEVGLVLVTVRDGDEARRGIWSAYAHGLDRFAPFHLWFSQLSSYSYFLIQLAVHFPDGGDVVKIADLL